MSSNPAYASISLSEMQKIQSVLKKAGYDANVLAEDQSLFNPAALLMMKLYLAGETSAHGLSVQLQRSFGTSTTTRVPYRSPLPRYAIQGLPYNLRKPKARPSFRTSEIQRWENEGGALSGNTT